MTENQGGSGPKPGWYPNPENPSEQRYWDGSKWQSQPEIKAQQPGKLPKPPKGSRRGVVATYRGWPMWVQIGLPILVLIIVVAAIAGGGEESSKDNTTSEATTTESPTTTATTTTDEAPEKVTGSSVLGGDPSENASDSNTPSVGWNGSVEVDTLRWRLNDSEATKTIGNQEYGLGAKANGLFIVADLSVINNKDESVTLTSENVSLVAGDNTYDADTNAETAFIGEGGKTFFLEDLGPGVTDTGKVGFDVAPKVLHEHPQLRFNELGFGETHGYITLPPLSG